MPNLVPIGRFSQITRLSIKALRLYAEEQLGIVYPALAAWVQEHGHETNGQPCEIFWNDPSEVPDPAQYRTEVLWPIR